MRLIDADKIPFSQREDGCLNDVAYRYDINEMPTIEPTSIAPSPSDPLTIEELREMDGEPVWIVHTDYTPFGKEYWGIVRDGFSGLPNCFVATRDENIQLLYSEYGKTWLAYRRKPKKGEERQWQKYC